MEAYCVKCRAGREIKNTKNIILRNGRPASRGICPICQTKTYKLGKYHGQN